MSFHQLTRGWEIPYASHKDSYVTPYVFWWALVVRSTHGTFQLPHAEAQGSIETVSRRDGLTQVRHLPGPDVNSPLCYRLDEAWHRWYSSALGQHLVHGLQGQTHIYCSDRGILTARIQIFQSLFSRSRTKQKTTINKHVRKMVKNVKNVFLNIR